jgi:hypothetical protein
MVIDGPHQTEIAQFSLAIFIDEDVGWLDVAVNESGRVEVVERFGHLVENVLAMSLCQNILANESVQINVHVLEYQVNIAVVLGADDLLQFYDVGVAELHEEHNLSVGALGIGGVIEGVEVLLESLDLFALLVDDLPHVAVCPAADLLLNVETG